MTAVVDLSVELHHRVERAAPILEGVRLRVLPGEHWAVVGANGSGKSTLLGIVSGEIWPSRGTVRVLGAEYGRVDKRTLRRRIGVVGAALFAGLPAGDAAEEIVCSGLDGRIGWAGPERPEALARAREALARVGAGELAARPYGVLSQGERQRVMIARALVGQPALLVLDEPCTGLDPAARERLLGALDALATEAAAPAELHVTHHLEELPGAVTHALVLHRGRPLASGPVEGVLTGEVLSAAFEAPCTVAVREVGGRARRQLLVGG